MRNFGALRAEFNYALRITNYALKNRLTFRSSGFMYYAFFGSFFVIVLIINRTSIVTAAIMGRTMYHF